jgi:transposase-like protein
MPCPYCNSERTNKNGKKNKKQRYICRDCNKSFSDSDNRMTRDIKQKELALLMYSHNSSLRSIQSVIEKLFDTKISFSLICKWIKSFSRFLNIDKDNEIKQSNRANKDNEDRQSNKDNDKIKSHTIEILEMDELYSKYYDSKKNEQKESKYGLLLIDNEIKLLHLK